jgi:hypothetical protein
MDRFGFKQQTKLHDNNTRRSLPIYRKFFWARPHESYNNTENHRNTKRHKHNKRILKLISLCLTVGTATPTFASDVGGVSATWSKPLDKKLQEQCKDAAQANINYMVQNTANKRLDFEIARLKNCGELMKAGIMFHKKSPYYAVCADVVLVNPPGTLPNHSHSITPNPLPVKPNGNASSLNTISIGNF